MQQTSWLTYYECNATHQDIALTSYVGLNSISLKGVRPGVFGRNYPASGIQEQTPRLSELSRSPFAVTYLQYR
jgi:hypothetical protein